MSQLEKDDDAARIILSSAFGNTGSHVLPRARSFLGPGPVLAARVRCGRRLRFSPRVPAGRVRA